MLRSLILHRWLPLAVLAAAVGMLIAASPALAGVSAQREPGPGPAPVDCDAACAERAKTYFDRCMATHDDEEACSARSEQLRADCLDRCGKPAEPRPPSISPRPAPRDCAGACAERAKAWYQTCVEEHADPEGCAARARAHQATCLETCDRPAEPKPIDCDTTCRRHAEQVLRKCEAAGGENCTARAREAHAACAERCAGAVEPPAPIDCATACERRARATYQRCTASSRDDCAALARRALAECKAGCSSIGTRPAPGRPVDPPVRPRRP